MRASEHMKMTGRLSTSRDGHVLDLVGAQMASICESYMQFQQIHIKSIENSQITEFQKILVLIFS
jgi:hypothetical protein